jgi:hypothetical protein
VNLNGKVTPVVPGGQVFWTYVDEKGEIRTLNKVMTTLEGLPGVTLAPVDPHATSIPARTCESCHTNPKSLGYGTSSSRSQAQLQGGAPVFQNLAEGYFGDIPDAKTARWQVPPIPEWPFSPDQLVTRTGEQVQSMPHLEDHPLTLEQRHKVEREGICIACHQHYNTPLWERIKRKVGPSLRPEDHDRAVEAALKALGGAHD